MLTQMMSDVFLLVMGVLGVGTLIITAVGLGLFVVGVIKGRKVENFDEIAPKIMKAVGIVMLIVGMIGMCVIGTGTTAYVTENYGLVSSNPAPKPIGPSNPVSVFEPLWGKGKDPEEAADEALAEFMAKAELAAADASYEADLEALLSGDAQGALYSTHPTDISSFCSHYPTNMKPEMLVAEEPAVLTQRSGYNFNSLEAVKRYRFESDEGDVWFVEMQYCYDSDISGAMGITAFYIEDLDYRAKNKNTDPGQIGFVEVLLGHTATNEKAVVINGEAFLMMDTGDPVYSSTELREMIDGGVLTISALKARKWEASCVESNAQSNFTDYYYELIPEDDKPIYAKITTVTGKDRIMGVVLYDKDQMLEDGIIYQIPANENASERAKETASEQGNENVTESDIETEGDVTESNM